VEKKEANVRAFEWNGASEGGVVRRPYRLFKSKAITKAFNVRLSYIIVFRIKGLQRQSRRCQ